MKLLAICSILFLVACSNSEFTSAPECSIDGNKLTCNGETIEVKDGQDGRQGDAGNDGRNGVDGIDGTDGTDGVDGVDGQDGMDGLDGADGLFTEIIDPCGAETTHDEVILVTRNGEHIAYFETPNSSNDRLVILKEGVNYITTDGTNCRFRIENGVLID